MPAPPDPLSVNISGPYSLDYKQIGIWTANVNDGISPYSYQWYKKLDGSGTWSALGTSQTQQVMMLNVGFTLKVVVTDDADENAEDTHYVSYGIPPK